MANTVRILITAKDEVSGTIDKIRDKATQLSKTDIGKGMAMGAGIAAFGMVKNAAMEAAGAVVEFAKGSVQAASDQREAMMLTQQVFESSSDSVIEWSKNSKDAFTSTEAMDFASKFGTAFKNVGMSLDETTVKAKEMTTLAGDLGSAFNTSSEEAAIALRSGLLGESEPLRRFGVFLDEAKTKAKAMAMGMEIVGGKLTDNQKVMARYALIMEQTADSQGMFGRDTESLADSSKQLEANIADLQAGIGGPLTQALNTATRSVLDLMEAFDSGADMDFGDRIMQAGDAVKIFNPLMWVANYNLGEIEKQEAKAASEARNLANAFAYATEDGKNLRDAASKAAKAVGKVGDEADPAAQAIKDAGDAADDAAKKFDDMKDSIEDLVDALITAAFEPEQLALELKIANKEVDILAKDLAKMVDGNGKPVKGKTWKQVNEAKLELSEAKERAQKLKFQLDAVDGVSQKDITGAIKGLGGRVANAADEAADLWWYVNKLSKVQPTGVLGSLLYKNKYIPTNADGGPIPPYGLSLVGENGPELIRMGAVGGMVKPSAGVAPSQATASGGVTISGPFYFQGIGSDVSAQAANRFGQATLDVIANGLREQRARLGAA